MKQQKEEILEEMRSLYQIENEKDIKSIRRSDAK